MTAKLITMNDGAAKSRNDQNFEEILLTVLPPGLLWRRMLSLGIPFGENLDKSPFDKLELSHI